jgi:predicted methyltransferase
MTVVEIRPGGGWYTEILSPYLRGEGRLIAAIPSAEGSRARYRQRFLDRQEERPEVFGPIEVATFDPPDSLELGEDGSADMVVTFRNTHNMVNDGGAEEAYAAFFRVLRPGGVLGVVQHRAAEGADAEESAQKGYVPEAYVIQIAEAAGFVLEERSEINANPNDTRDYEEGVWTLPPVLRLGEQDRERYLAIGESDRMTLRFRKPE